MDLQNKISGRSSAMQQQWNMNEEVEIDLIDFMWRMLIQWKLLLLCVICSILIVMPVYYLKRYKDYQRNEAEQARVQQIITNYDDYEKEEAKENFDIESVMTKYTQLQEKKTAADNNITMLLDWEKINHLVEIYIIQAQDASDLAIILDMQTAAFTKPKVKSRFAKFYGFDDYTYFSALTTGVRGQTAEGTKAEFIVDATLLEDMDTAKLGEIIDEVFTENYGEIEAAAGTYQCKKVSVYEESRKTIDVLNSQSDTKTQIKTLETELKDMISQLDEDQLLELEKKTGESFEIEEDWRKQFQSEELLHTAEEYGLTEAEMSVLNQEYKKPTIFDWKAVILGLLLGGAAYAGVNLLLTALCPRVCSGKDVAAMMGTQNFGEIHFYEPKNNLQMFIKDPWVWKIKNRKAGSLEEQIGQISERICLHLPEETPFDFMLIPDTTDQSKSVADRVAAKTGRKCTLIDISNESDIRLEYKLNDLSNAVLMFTYNRSTYAQLTKLLNLCNSYHVAIKGTLLVEA